MDKKSTVIGVVLLALGLLLMFNQAQQQAKLRENQPREGDPQAQQPSGSPDTTPTPGGGDEQQTGEQEEFEEPDGLLSATKTEVEQNAPETLTTLTNGVISVDFTNYGGAIRSVTLNGFATSTEDDSPYVFNAAAKLPALSINLDDHGKLAEFAPVYTLNAQDDHKIEFSREVLPGLNFVRVYQLSRPVSEAEAQAARNPKEELIDGETLLFDADPYLIRHTTYFTNTGKERVSLDQDIYLNIGTAPPTKSDTRGDFLNFGYWDGEDYEYLGVREFKESQGFLGIGARRGRSEISLPERAVWAAVKNQFFTAVLTPEVAAKGVHTMPVELPPWTGTNEPKEGITGSVVFGQIAIEPGESESLSMAYYVGPKEYSRLSAANFDQHQVQVMQFGFLDFLAIPLLKLLLGIQAVVGNYGVAIICLTVIIRLAIWPLTAKAAKSAKKMQKIQEPMKALREKHKDNPQKLQQETMKLFQEHKVNPAAGCLPLFIQIPIFIAFFYMLRSAAELRLEEFLWIRDLSQPDHLFHWGVNVPFLGEYFNLLPVLMCISMAYQMKMTPTTMDTTQQKILRMMPIFIFFVCYRFSAGLTLYWTISNCFSILQQYITNKRKDDDEAEKAPADVTGAKKRKRAKAKPAKKKYRPQGG